MKNKLLIGIFAGILCIAAVGCGVKQNASSPQNNAQTTIPVETVEETEEVTTTEATLPPVDGVEGTVLYNEDNFALVLMDLVPAEDGQCMTVTAVNKTNMTVYMRLMNFSVNSFMMENLPTVELTAQQTLETSYTFTAQELEFNGIEKITDLQFSLWVYDSEDFKTPDVADGVCRYYPYGRANAPAYEREAQPTDQVLVDNDRFAVTVTTADVGTDVVFQLHLKNKSDKELLFIAPYALVDGVVIDPLWAYNVSAGKQRNTVITFTAQQLKEAQVETPESVEIAIQIGDHEDWSAGVYFHELFAIELPAEQAEVTE